MVRAQIQLTPEQVRALRQLSLDTGRSIADLVRQAVDSHLRIQKRAGRAQKIQRALEIAGKFSSGTSDTSSRHDKYLADSIEP
jgi:hypothetical protein